MIVLRKLRGHAIGPWVCVAHATPKLDEQALPLLPRLDTMEIKLPVG